MSVNPEKLPPLLIVPELQAAESAVSVDGDSASHALRSLRLRDGDSVELTNGRGLLARGQITKIDRRGDAFTAQIVSTREVAQSTPDITLATALPKGERLGTLLDMATQLGVRRIVPLNCRYSVVEFQDRMRARWQRVFESACRQSRRCWLPTIESPQSIEGLVAGLAPDDVLLFGDHRAEAGSPAIAQSAGLVVVVGPEGGFDGRETALLSKAPGAYGVAIGTHILRTETAAIAMLAMAQLAIRPNAD